jgi:PAS domain S-box-containing protein
MQTHHFPDEIHQMQLREVKQLVESTADAAFAIDGAGLIVAWNVAATDLFGLTVEEAIGQPCDAILCGEDERGRVCSADCSVRQAVCDKRQVNHFDLQVKTPQGRQWCNVSILTAEGAGARQPYVIHLVRGIDVRKRMELAMRDFLVKEAGLPEEHVKALAATSRSAARAVALSNRELDVLRLLAQGATTAAIAEQLRISPTTVNNHTQHILQKLGAHTRLEAIRRAEHAGLI